ncbi:pectinesterase [Medicago truncatula]|uniref:Pectinesterase n=1 Tax=Medicago truncatula TaxID=3880 RepID=G7J6F7_MEDTR|nr:pectinesterase [Medicago truncatula]
MLRCGRNGIYKNISANRIVFQNCSIMSNMLSSFPYVLTVKTYLARQWKAFSRSFFINDNFGNFIQQ